MQNKNNSLSILSRLDEYRLKTMNDISNAFIGVAAVQMVSGMDVAENLAQARYWTLKAAEKGAKLVVLPEYFCMIGATDAEKLAHREVFGQGVLQDFLSALAQEANVWLVGGTIPLMAESAAHLRNSTLVYRPDGSVAGRYDKIHLFGFDNGREHYDESAIIEPGTVPVAVDTEIGRIGLSICYDLRFPELFRAVSPVDLIVLPAAFTYTTGQAHWDILLRARAIENQCYVLASAQGGKHRCGRRTWGHSMLIDPWGQIVSECAEGEGLVLGDLNHARLARIRSQLPALRHRVLGA
jgi:deaminated glutathione amidase